MLFFWASLNFTAYKTQPHGAHPTHGEIKAPLSHWKPIVNRQRPRKLRSGFANMHPEVQARWFSSFPTQTSTHIQTIAARLLLLITLKESSKKKEQHKRELLSTEPYPQPPNVLRTSRNERNCSVSALDSESTWCLRVLWTRRFSELR